MPGDVDWEAYKRGDVDLCHLCKDSEAVTSDGVCSACAEKYPRATLPPSELKQLRETVRTLEAELRESRKEWQRWKATEASEDLQRDYLDMEIERGRLREVLGTISHLRCRAHMSDEPGCAHCIAISALSPSLEEGDSV